MAKNHKNIRSDKKKRGNTRKGVNEKGQFVIGNKAAEKWTQKTTVEALQKIIASLSDGVDDKGNIVRANDIKLLGEVCLMNGIDPDTWSYLREKFKKNKTVLRLVGSIQQILECRLIYSGGMMDMFILKNHYKYKDKHEVDTTTNGESLNDAGIDKLTPDEKFTMLKLKRKMNS